MPDYFRGYVVPKMSRSQLKEAVTRFNRGAEHYTDNDVSCYGLSCCNCILCCNDGDRDSKIKAFAEYAKSKGYKITREDLNEEDYSMEKNTIRFTPGSRGDVDLLQILVHGWVSVMEMREPDHEHCYVIETNSDSVDVHLNVERMQSFTPLDFDEMYREWRELYRLVDDVVYSTIKVSGEVRWPDQDRIHVLAAAGVSFQDRTEYNYKEMTVSQIEKALGYKIKVVGERW